MGPQPFSLPSLNYGRVFKPIGKATELSAYPGPFPPLARPDGPSSEIGRGIEALVAGKGT